MYESNAQKNWETKVLWVAYFDAYYDAANVVKFGNIWLCPTTQDIRGISKCR